MWSLSVGLTFSKSTVGHVKPREAIVKYYSKKVERKSNHSLKIQETRSQVGHQKYIFTTMITSVLLYTFAVSSIFAEILLVLCTSSYLLAAMHLKFLNDVYSLNGCWLTSFPFVPITCRWSLKHLNMPTAQTPHRPYHRLFKQTDIWHLTYIRRKSLYCENGDTQTTVTASCLYWTTLSNNLEKHQIRHWAGILHLSAIQTTFL